MNQAIVEYINIEYKTYKNITVQIITNTKDTGGANPLVSVSTKYFINSIEVEQKDLFKKNYLKYLSDQSKILLKNSKYPLFDDYEKYLTPIAENFHNLYFSEKGVHIIFDYYQIGPRYLGNVEIIVPYNIDLVKKIC